jgi:hypothetical protein
VRCAEFDLREHGEHEGEVEDREDEARVHVQITQPRQVREEPKCVELRHREGDSREREGTAVRWEVDSREVGRGQS